jgi:hypothetical protein
LCSSGRRWVYGIFALIALEIWGRIFFMGQKVEEIAELIERCERRAVARTGATLRTDAVAP